VRQLNEQSYCGWCRGELEYLSTWASRCRECGYRRFINPNPCSSILVVKNNAVMMVQRAIEPQKGKYDFPGGFMELTDNSMEEAALRELKEEVGISPSEITELKYLGSSIGPPYDWLNTAIINVAFYYECRLKDDEQIVKPDEAENSEIVWVSAEDIENIDYAWDIDKIKLSNYFKESQ